MNKGSYRQCIAPTVEALIATHFHPHGPLSLSTNEIREYIECVSGRKVSPTAVGKALKSLGFQSEVITAGSVRRTMYSCGQCDQLKSTIIKFKN